jgi:cbb3-type cytochrome oxidase cytochrome c subunit
LTGAHTLNAGLRLIERYGCYNCHKFEGHFERLAKEKKSGPSLLKIASKLNETWIQKWLWEPTAFRPTTLMPAFWKNHNNSDPESMKKAAVEIEAIAHAIVKKSKPYEPLKLASTAQGNIEKGKELVGTVGCLACHAVDDFPRKNPADPTEYGFKDSRIPMFGPELNQLGSKVSKEWLVSWMINPMHYDSSSRMPSLRLTEQEAIDVTEYLLTKKNEAFEQAAIPTPEDSVRDEYMTYFLEKNLAPAEAQVKLASMSLEQKKDFLGEKFVGHYGCYACHAIEGFENAPWVGPELTKEGSKDALKFSFENVQLFKYNRTNYIFTKIRTPRIWDIGKERNFDSKLKMPQFGFDHTQAEAIAAVVLGHENRNVEQEALFPVNGKQEAIIEARRVIHQKNCIGCHAIDQKAETQKGGYILSYFPEDKTMGPPLLYTQGRKTQQQWLHSYLLNPNVMIRPWVKVRMPQFYMTGEQSGTIVKGLAAQDGAPNFVDKHFNVLSASDYQQAGKLVETLACLGCHAPAKPGEDLAGKAPYFQNIKYRLSGPWVSEWLHDPQAIMPGTRMPTLWMPQDDTNPKSPKMAVPGYFGDDADKQIEAIRDYLFQYPGVPSLPSPRADVHGAGNGNALAPANGGSGAR